jgi:GTP 3',8-cyclase
MSVLLPHQTHAADRFARPLRDLRISVTDRCNFRCRYCMPMEVFGPDFAFLERDELLSFEEITRLVRLFAQAGATKVRLTGGEPLLRRDLPELIAQLTALDGVTDVALTTNGALLKNRVTKLVDAGLNRVTVSLDALDDETFTAINGVAFRVQPVLDGIDAAIAAGLDPVKINMVVKRGVNDHAVAPMAEYFRERGLTLRFIEYMDVGNSNHWKMDEVVPSSEVVELLHRRWPLEPVAPNYHGEVANRYRYLDGGGEIGLISSVTQPFCGACSRARLSADGKLYTCLFAAEGHDLRAELRGGSTDQQLADSLRGVWSARSDRYSEHRSEGGAGGPKVEMSYIGG